MNIKELDERITELEAQNKSLQEALKMLLPMAIVVPSTSETSAQALLQLSNGLKNMEQYQPRSDEFWTLASAMLLALSSRALDQHPQDEEVAAIFQGLRQGRKQ